MIRFITTFREKLGRSPFLVIVLLGIIALTATRAPAADEQAGKVSYKGEDITTLNQWIEKQRLEHNVPGVAVVVMHGDKQVLYATYGFCDLDKKQSVNDQTIFPIGSTAKPFTATLAAMLVSKRLMSWDDPVTKYLPYFKLPIKADNPKDRVTIRDLLSHRTGFFHMDIIQKAINWEEDPDYAKRPDRYTRKSLLEEAAGYEPVDTFREKHNYSNVGMVAAAMASGKAACKSWDDLMEEMLFKPLGMNRSSTSILRIHADHEVATGHLLEENGYRPCMLINMDVISPAGGINASLADMTQWLKCLLCDGKHGEKRLIDSKALNEMWEVQIDKADLGGMFPGAKYGLGWFIKEWNGFKVVEHGGNALGFSANVGLIPELNIGYVMLSNALPNPLQMTLGDEVWKTLINE